MISLLNNGILKINPECQISNSLLFSKLKNFNNFSTNIVTPSFKILLETIVPYLSQISIKNLSQLEKFIGKNKSLENMPLSLLEFEISIAHQINENFKEILQNKENYYYDYIFKLIIGLTITLSLTILIIIIITKKLYQYYLIIKNITLENTHLNLDSLRPCGTC